MTSQWCACEKGWRAACGITTEQCCEACGLARIRDVSSAENIGNIVKNLLQNGCRPQQLCIPPEDVNDRKPPRRRRYGEDTDTESQEEEEEEGEGDDEVEGEWEAGDGSQAKPDEHDQGEDELPVDTPEPEYRAVTSGEL